jgi:hypothetical protein
MTELLGDLLVLDKRNSFFFFFLRQSFQSAQIQYQSETDGSHT